MFRKLFLVCLAAATASGLFADELSRTMLIDNFSDGDDDGWTYDDFTAGTPWGPAVYDASSGEYLIEAADLVPADDPFVGTIVATWADSRGEPLFANGVGRVKVRANAYGTTAGILLRANDQDHTDYGFFGSTTFGTFYIERFDLVSDPDAPQTIIAMADPDLAPFAAGEDWYIEGKAVGDRIELKAWRVGDPEPEEPLLSVRDDAIGPETGSLLCLIVFFDPVAVEDDFVEVSASFDDVTFKPKHLPKK